MSQYDEGYSKELVEQAKKDIQTLVKEKSILVKVDFTNQDDIDRFFDD
jgi:DNA-damage-inducible protein J